MDTPLPNEQGVVLEMYGNEQWSRDVIESFPSLREQLEENSGLLHVQMGTLAGAVRDALESRETEFPLQVCVFLATTLSRPRVIEEIENAVRISFVHAEEFRETEEGRTVLDAMPARVRDVLLDQQKIDGP